MSLHSLRRVYPLQPKTNISIQQTPAMDTALYSSQSSHTLLRHLAPEVAGAGAGHPRWVGVQITRDGQEANRPNSSTATTSINHYNYKLYKR